MLHFVTIHADLVTTNDSLQTVLLAKALGDVGAELHANTALAGPATLFLLRVGPEHLHHETSLAGLALVVPVELSDIVESDLVVGEETTVEYEVLLAHKRCQG